MHIYMHVKIHSWLDSVDQGNTLFSSPFWCLCKLKTRCCMSPHFICWALNIELCCHETAIGTIIFPVTGGIRPWDWCLSGGGAQRSRCGCLAEGVPEGHAGPPSHQGAVHSLHQYSLCVTRPFAGTCLGIYWDDHLTHWTLYMCFPMTFFASYLLVSNEWPIWGIFEIYPGEH